ncbi:MAG: hypothetical protein GX447_02635 [Elusimicrobia bacterium]|nr:hypothetical protein [Elusimicrobiota bacterium]
MKKIFFVFFCFFSSCANIERKEGFDGYFTDFSLNNIEGRDYEIDIKDRGAVCSSFAVHGGNLEKGTDILAESFASNKLNYYAFKVISKKNAWEKHITSAKFNEPRAISLAKKSKIAVSFHAMADKSEKICIGGLNKDLAQSFDVFFNRYGFKTEYPCRRLPGRSPKNIANMAAEGGVQLEISVKLLKKLDKKPAKLLKFIEAADKAAKGFCY